MQIEKDIRDSFFSGIYKVMKEDQNSVILTADHGALYLTKISHDFSDRYINVGISEQNMVNVASGLALNGKSVYIYSINNFMILRALEQINIKDLAGDDNHYSATIKSKIFNGKSKIEQHKLVYKALNGKMGTELHALALNTIEG